MFYSVSNKRFFHEILLHYFNMKESASESRRILAKIYMVDVPTEQYCQNLFEWFKSGIFDFEYEKFLQPFRQHQKKYF